jgi:Na+-transporting NADH:ubiquinone oxidoreductase subunit NqrB
MNMSSFKGVMSFSCGGAILLFALFLVVGAAENPLSGPGPAVYGVVLGFLAFFLLAIGIDLILESGARAK